MDNATLEARQAHREARRAQQHAEYLHWQAQFDTQVQAALSRIPSTLVDFPQIPITERQRLPVFCAVYLAVKGHETVLYVGVTENLRRRWQTHQRWRAVCAAGATHIAWLQQADVHIGREVERYCIQRFDPPFNAHSAPLWNLLIIFWLFFRPIYSISDIFNKFNGLYE